VILHVDDSQDDAFFVKRAIEASGMGVDVTHVEGGQQAIDYLNANPAPDLMLLDLKMPAMNGFEVLQWLSERRFSFPVVVLTSSALIEDQQRAMSLGAKVMFVKSDNYDALIQDVARRLHAATNASAAG
jgi:CheY-like chemotaxis protein